MNVRAASRSGARAAFLSLVLVLASGPLDTATASGSRASNPIIRIGVAAPLSGNNAFFAPAWVKGMRLAARQLRLRGKYAHARVEVTVRDTRSDPSSALNVARRFVGSSVVGVIGPFSSHESLASEEVYHHAGIPELSFGADPAITQRGYRNVIVLNANSTVQGQAMARFAKQLHVGSAAAVDDSVAYGQSVANAFTARARREGIAIDGTVAVNPSSSDDRAALRSIVAKHPDAIYLGVSSLPTGIHLCRQLRTAGFAGILLGDALLFNSRFIPGCGSVVGRAYVGFQVPPYDSTPRLRRFSAAYRKQFGTAPEGYAVYGYEQMTFLLMAINTAQSTQHAAVIAALHRITVSGILGSLHVNGHGNLVHAPMYMYGVSGKRFNLLGRI